MGYRWHEISRRIEVPDTLQYFYPYLIIWYKFFKKVLNLKTSFIKLNYRERCHFSFSLGNHGMKLDVLFLYSAYSSSPSNRLLSNLTPDIFMIM